MRRVWPALVGMIVLGGGAFGSCDLQRVEDRYGDGQKRGSSGEPDLVITRLTPRVDQGEESPGLFVAVTVKNAGTWVAREYTLRLYRSNTRTPLGFDPVEPTLRRETWLPPEGERTYEWFLGPCKTGWNGYVVAIVDMPTDLYPKGQTIEGPWTESATEVPDAEKNNVAAAPILMEACR